MTVLKNDLPVARPPSFAESREGELFIATGLGRSQRWNGYDSSTEDAGINAPETSCSMATSGGEGSIQGVYYAYVRFVDDEGIPSNFSPMATLEQTSSGVATINYTSIPKSTESRVAGREIWRNTDGQSVTFYLDVELENTTGTTASSTATDAALLARESMRYTTIKGYPNANRFTAPPSHMSVVAYHKDRTWWMVPAEYDEGTATVALTAVTGAGTNWSSHMEGLYLSTSSGRAVIDTVKSATSLVLETTNIPNGAYGNYAIVPDSSEYDAIYFSEDGEPESVPATNSVVAYPDGDRMVGAMVLYTDMYLLKSRHIYRLTTCSDPRNDTGITLVAERGCVNHRCWCRVEGMAFLVDELGAYFFNGNTLQSVSDPIQNYWRDNINWAVKQWFHVAHDPQNQCVRFYYAKDSDTGVKYCLAFNYRQQTWQEDSYGANIRASCEGVIGNDRRVLAGVAATPNLMYEGTADANTAISYDLKLGAFRLLEREYSQPRKVGIRFEPTTNSETMHLSHYYNHRATAEAAGRALDDGTGASVAIGASVVALDVSKATGYLDWSLDGHGFEGDTPANRFLEVELTGSTIQAVTLYEVEIQGVEGERR